LENLNRENPVFLLGALHNQSFFLPSGSIIYVLCLLPQNDRAYLSRHLNDLEYHCVASHLVCHAQQLLGLFPTWEIQLLSIRGAVDSSLLSGLFLDCAGESGIPALLAWISSSELQGMITLDQLILESLVGHTIIPPMAGLADVPLAAQVEMKPQRQAASSLQVG
jgi:hypothetical protein